MAMFAPSHPGEILKEEVLDEMGLNITDAAELLGVSRKTLSKVANGNGSITPEMALRLEQHFEPSADMWLRLQNAYDLWRVRKDARNGLIAIEGKGLKRSELNGRWIVIDSSFGVHF
jgi:addiction module HigA family antidote